MTAAMKDTIAIVAGSPALPDAANEPMAGKGTVIDDIPAANEPMFAPPKQAPTPDLAHVVHLLQDVAERLDRAERLLECGGGRDHSSGAGRAPGRGTWRSPRASTPAPEGGREPVSL